MTENILLKIHEELVAIRELLAKQQSAAPAKSYSGSTSSTGATDGPPPQPSEVIPNAGDVQIHFGKNNGKALSSLSERSLSWYATDQPPRLDSSGKPYPPRPQEVLLKNAARTLWHTQKGSLAGGTPDTRTERHAPPGRPAPGSEAAHLSDEENVPF